MICTAVPREAIDIVWSDVSNMLNKAIETSGGKYHIDDIYHHLIEGYYNLWLIVDNKIGGRRMMEWLPIAMDRLTNFARDCGCSHLEGYGRKAWSKILKKYNWNPEYIAYRMEIKNG